MRILALETSGFSGSVAVADDERLRHVEMVAAGQRTAQGLAPAIAAALRTVGWRTAEVQLVAVTIGPGSFTGLRVGVATAKAFAYAIRCEILGIDTLAVLAQQTPPDVERIQALLEAHRRQLFASTFRRRPNGSLEQVVPTQIVEESGWLESIRSDTALTGPVLDRLAVRLPPTARLVAREFWEPTAAAVADLAWRDWQAGRRDDVWTLLPQYYRPSAAEEKKPV